MPLLIYGIYGLYNCSQVDYHLLPVTYDICPTTNNDYHLIGVTHDQCCSNDQICRCCKYVNNYSYFLGCPYYSSIWHIYFAGDFENLLHKKILWYNF